MSYLNKQEIDVLQKARLKIRALNHPLRQKMLSLIKDQSNRINVTDIYTKMRIEQSVTSQHLGILRKQNFVNTERDGKVIWYSVNDSEIKSFLKDWEKQLD